MDAHQPMERPQDVLIVDDNASVLAVWRRMLEAGGYRVHSADNALEALQLARTTQPAVALCDVHMPGHSGLWLAEQFQEHSPATAVVIVTADNHVPPPESLKPGIIGYLLKPVAREQLLAMVGKAERWSAAVSASEGPSAHP